VAEDDSEWKKVPPVELLVLVKEFVCDPEAEEEAIQALLTNIKLFRRKVGKQK
jgi:hypothetical protein